MVKNLPAMWVGPGLTPGSGRSSGEGNGNPFQDSCLEIWIYIALQEAANGLDGFSGTWKKYN